MCKRAGTNRRSLIFHRQLTVALLHQPPNGSHVPLANGSMEVRSAPVAIRSQAIFTKLCHCQCTAMGLD